MKLFLVRHGQSQWNIERRLQGQTYAVPLTELGVSQAAKSAEELAEQLDFVSGKVLLCSSDLQRADQTAQIIAQRIGTVVHHDSRWREQHYGVLEGRLTEQLHPEPIPEGTDITEVAWGGGESIEQVYARVRQALLWVWSTGCHAAVLVSHGETIRVALTVIDQLNRGEPDQRPHRLVTWPVIENGAILPFELRIHSSIS